MPPRCRAAAPIAVMAGVVVACAPRSAPPATGGAEAPPAAQARPDEPAPEPWPMLEQAARWATPSVASFPSQGHAPPRYLATPRVPAEHLSRYESLVAGVLVPEGFAVALWHQDRETGAPGPIYAMIRRDTGWEFRAMNESGMLMTGDVSLCARCHAEAPADHLFGPPRPGGASLGGEPE